MKNYIEETFNEINEIERYVDLFESSIEYSINTFEKENIRVFLDYFYDINKKLFDIFDVVSFVKQEQHLFNEYEVETAAEALNLLFSSIDYAYNRSDFFVFVKTLTVKTKKEEYFKKVYLDFFEGQHLCPDKQEERLNMERELHYLFNEYSKNVENVSYIQDKSIDEIIVEQLEDNEKNTYFTIKNGKYYLKPSFSNLKSIKSNCDSAELRKIACKLLSEEGKHYKRECNLSLANKLIDLRSKIATLFNKKSYVEFAIERNLLDKTDKVEAFIESVHKSHYEKALTDVLDLREFIKAKFDVNNLTYQDLYYYAGCYRGEKLSDNLSNYNRFFKTDHVLNEVFKLYQDIFDLTFKKIENEPTFDMDGVETYEVYYKKELKTYIILDIYEREEKPEDNYVSPLKRCFKNNVGILLVNLFFKENKEMNLDDIASLLHEFGHVAEAVVYNAEYIFDDVTAYYEKDACEIISTTMEQYAKDKDFLLSCSSVEENEKTLTEEDINSILKTEKFLSSMGTIYLLACAEYDYKIHNNFKGNIELLHVDIFNKRSPLFDELGENLAYNFVHIFDGFYSGNYYCYVLAEVLAENIFKAFKEDESLKKMFKYKIAARQEGIRLEDNLKVFYNNEMPESLSFITK